MKTPSFLTFGGLAVVLTSCGAFKNFNQAFNQPLSSGFDPLNPPGASEALQGTAVVGPTYSAGQWVETAMPNAAFFRAIPKGNARADKILPVATPLKVISIKGTYVQVELDSGDVGFVPEIMVITRGAGNEPPLIPDYGPIPPPVDPALGTPGDPADPPLPPSIPGIPSVPAVPDVPAPPLPGGIPAVPDIPAPPTVPGVTE